MSKILVSDREQLKCNFCTKWFSVSGAFASIQRYSINSCPACLNNFQYKIIDSQTYDIYQIVLIKSGIKLISDQLTNKNSCLIGNISNREGSVILASEVQQKVRQAQQMYTNQINKLKKKLEQYYKNKFDKWIEQWKNTNSQLQVYRQTNFKAVFQQATKTSEKSIILQQISQRIQDNLKAISKNVESIMLNEQILKQSSSNIVSQHIRQPKQHIVRNSCVNDLKKLRKKVFEYDSENMLTNRSLHSTASNTSNNDKKQLFTQQPSKQKKLLKSKKKLQPYHNQVPSLIKESENWNKRISYSKDSDVISSNKKLNKIPSKSSLFLKKSSSTQRLEINNTLITNQNYSKNDQIKQLILKTLKNGVKFQSYLPFHTSGQSISQYQKQNGSKNLMNKIFQINKQTIIMENQCQLISRDISGLDFWCYLATLDWNQEIKALKLVKVKLQDSNFDILLHFLSQKCCRNIHTLVLTNNLLTDACLQGLLAFFNRNCCTYLNSIYLGNNFIKPSHGNKYVKILKDIGIHIYI